MAKVKKYGTGGLGGVIPEMMGALGPKNKGFALGILPGLFQRERYEDQQAAELAKASAAQQQAEAEKASQGMKKGGSVKGWGAARGARKAKIY